MAKRKKKSKAKRSWLKYLWLVPIAIILFAAWYFFWPNTGSFSQGEFLYIRTGSNYEEVRKALITGGFVRDIASFDDWARREDYTNHIIPGKYKIGKVMSSYSMVKLLRSGKQTPVIINIKKLKTKQDFINLISRNLEADSIVLKRMLLDTVYLDQFGLDTNTIMCAVMPDTYEFSWNTTADKAFRTIEKHYAKFWTSERKAKARALKISPQEAIILASIVDEETNKAEDRPKIASVYLNRISKGIKLQADPTAKFASGDFALRRITTAHTRIVSPYNTYQVYGLPPGPICTPSNSVIDAVLATPKTSYLYFCAKEDFSGYSRFASTYREHLKNAALYQAALNRRNIH